MNVKLLEFDYKLLYLTFDSRGVDEVPTRPSYLRNTIAAIMSSETPCCSHVLLPTVHTINPPPPPLSLLLFHPSLENHLGFDFMLLNVFVCVPCLHLSPSDGNEQDSDLWHGWRWPDRKLRICGSNVRCVASDRTKVLSKAICLIYYTILWVGDAKVGAIL